MHRTNTRPDIDDAQLDPERELPASDGHTNQGPQEATQTSAAEPDELEQVKAERDTLRERAARMQAEFENARKRTTREQQEFRNLALEDALRSLLPVLDSLDLAMEAPVRSVEEFRSGVELIQKQLHEAMGKLGLRQIPAKGEPFDPLLHEAVDIVESTGTEDNQVVEELQRGYKLKHRLLRPAMVRVARNPQHTNRGDGGF
jgi:molecular chaperone GrpE